MLHSLISKKQAIVDYKQAPYALPGFLPHVDSMRGIVSYQRGEEIYANTDLAEHWYCVISGAARKYALLSDGRRRIIDFLLPGDFFGFRARHPEFFATDAIA